MSVFRDVTIVWKGNEHVVTPTMRIMRQIETNGVSLTDIAVRASQGRAPISHIAHVLSALLATARPAVIVDEEDVYSVLVGGNQKVVTGLVTATLSAFTPDNGEPVKNQDAPGPKKKTSDKGRSSKKAAA